MAPCFKASRPGLPGRILMTSDAVGDVWDYSLGLSAALSRLGVQVFLATIGPPLSDERRRRARATPNVTLFEEPRPVTWDSALWPDHGASADWLLHLERSVRPDLVHVNALHHAAVTWTAPYLVVAHRCMIGWSLAVGGQKADRNWGIYRRRVAHGLRNASLIVAPTSATASDLEEHYGASLAVQVIPYGHDYRAADEPKKEYIITAAGFWDDGNNLEILELAAPYLSWPMFMAGCRVDAEGNQRPPRNICALGQLTDAELDAWLARSSIYVMPSRYLICPMSILRAAVAGCALVLGGIPALRETWEGAALFVPPGDRVAVRTALDKLVSDSIRRREMQARARERAGSLTGPAMVSAYATAYQDAISAAAQRNVLSESLVGA